jgi:hypothetical protein
MMAVIRILAPGEVPVALLSNVLPSPLSGVASAGSSSYAARADHNHDDSDLRAYVTGQQAALEDAKTSALSAISTDKTAAQSAISTDRTAATNAISTARSSALTDIETARAQAVSELATRTRNTLFEIDFGTESTRSFVGTVAGVTGITTAHAVTVSQSGAQPTGKSVDENEMDAFICRGLCLVNGSLKVFIDSVFGPVKGKFKFIATY